MNPIRILVLEDEQAAAKKILGYIKELAPEAEVEWLTSVVDGITYLRNTEKLDLIFSDIELLDGNAFKIYDTVSPSCPIVFCTAYDKFYIDAFAANGIAYLLKPYTKEQFKKAWNKYVLLFGNKTSENLISTALISEIKQLVAKEDVSYKSTFTVKKRDGVFLLRTDSISYFQAQGDFVVAFDHTNTKHIINESLSTIAENLDPKQFFQINRSEIIKFDAIVKYNNYTKNRLAVTLALPKTILYTTNSRTPAFRTWIEHQ